MDVDTHRDYCHDCEGSECPCEDKSLGLSKGKKQGNEECFVAKLGEENKKKARHSPFPKGIISKDTCRCSFVDLFTPFAKAQ